MSALRTILIALISQIVIASNIHCEVLNHDHMKLVNLSDIHQNIYDDTSRQVQEIFNASDVNSCRKYEFEKFRRQPIFSHFDTKRYIYSEQQLNYSYTFFYGGDQFQGKESIVTLGTMGITARLQSSVYTDLLIHHYDNFDELKQSGGPEVNQELCLNQLKYFTEKAERISKHTYRTKDINFYRLIDSYGRRGSGLLLGNSVWLGDYNECLRLNLSDENNDKIDTRYCLLNLKFHDWTQEDPASRLIALKMGACLPKSCDSRMYKDKYELVERLANAAVGSHDLNGIYVSSLYCLPDNQSKLAVWYYNSRTVLTAALLAGWISFLVYSTYKYEQHLSSDKATKITEDEVSSGGKAESSVHTGLQKQSHMIEVYRILSIKINIEKLFNTTDNSSLLENSSPDESMNKTNQSVGIETVSSEQKSPLVDLSSLEGIKVICMCYVILGHVLMCTTMVMANGKDMASTTSISWFIANLTPAFAVNSFFCITGILTSYLLYKTNQMHHIMRKPIAWLGLIVYRYFRILPLYLIVVLYLKNVAKFTGSGPLWDYGTSSIGQRRICEKESILWTILFGANFKSPFQHCIPSAWYLANDFQFFLVTPIFLSALYMSKKFGTRLLIWSIMIGYLAGMTSIFMTNFDNLVPIAKFMPHGLKTYITFFEHNYAHPQYRIPAYLIGLLTGFILHTYEHNKLVFRKKSKEKEVRKLKRQLSKLSMVSKEKITTIVERVEEEENGDKNYACNNMNQEEASDWPDAFKRYGLSMSALCVFVCSITPLIATRLPFNKFLARLLVSLIMPSYHVLFSIAVAIFILLSSTGHGNKLLTRILSSPLWKPFARLSLSVVLINIEVINYFIQCHKYTFNINDEALFVLNLSCIVVTYIAATIVCIFFEAPLRGISNLTLTHVMKKLTGKSRDKIKVQ